MHIVMSDQRMPQITGVELLTKVKARHPHAIRMLFTGFADLESIIAAINQGHIYQFLKKPWQPEELLAAVRQAAVEYDRLETLAHRARTARRGSDRAQDAGFGPRDRSATTFRPPRTLSHAAAPFRTSSRIRTPRHAMDQRRHSLLIVDDEVDVLESLRHQFHRSYRVLTSVSGSQAIEILEHDDVELILSDQRMPGMSGDRFLREARRLKPDAIRMLFTGYADIQAVISAVNEGHIFRYILKPWDTRRARGDHSPGGRAIRPARRAPAADRPSCKRPIASSCRPTKSSRRPASLKTAFIEVASHEFNTPITLVLGLTELLRLSNPNRSDQEQEILRQITASGQQLARLVTNMLTLLRAEDFRRTMRPQPGRPGRAHRPRRRPGSPVRRCPPAPACTPARRRPGVIRDRRRQDAARS